MAGKDKDKKAPIVVKRIIQGGGHHGGAWKVAYADFVTAMMAFFLLMWIMGSTTKEQKAAISEYFRNPSAAMGDSTKPPKATGQEGPGGSSTSMIDMGGGMDQPLSKEGDVQPDLVEPNPEEILEKEKEKEKGQMKELAEKLEQAIEADKALAKYRDQLLIDMTDEGLRIQIIDKENRSMFDIGSARLLPGKERLLQEIAKFIAQVPNRVSITGHTDARPYSNPNYTNWELSADRANAARRYLINGGLPAEKIAKVVGLASSVLFDPKDPMAPMNRRTAIIVLNRNAVEHLDAQPLVSPTPAASPSAPPAPAHKS